MREAIVMAWVTIPLSVLSFGGFLVLTEVVGVAPGSSWGAWAEFLGFVGAGFAALGLAALAFMD